MQPTKRKPNKTNEFVRPAGCLPVLTVKYRRPKETISAHVSSIGIYCTGYSFGIFPTPKHQLPSPSEVEAAYVELCNFGGYHSRDCIKVSSYKLKHLVERKVGLYISNGACIMAAALAGLHQVIRSFDRNTVVHVPRPLITSLIGEGVDPQTVGLYVPGRRKAVVPTYPVVVVYESIGYSGRESANANA